MYWKIRRTLARFLLIGLTVVWPLGSTPAAMPDTKPAAVSQALAKLPALAQQQEKVLIDLEALLSTYIRGIRGVESQAPDRVYLRMLDGQKILYDDGRVKGFEEQMYSPDLEDMLAQPYKLGKPTTVTPSAYNPGRVRVEAFFNALYGATAAQVQGNLVPVSFIGATVAFNANHGAAAALAKVGLKLSEILARNPNLRTMIFPLGGSYNRRQIAGTGRTSPHSWGIAIDLHKGTYWRWGKILSPLELLALQVAYPWEIVAAFEEQGFIWGGKWFHHDTMHFEYRPELVAKTRLQTPANPEGQTIRGASFRAPCW